MRFARTLSLYMIRETAVYCAFAFFILTLLLLAQNLLRRLDELFLIGMTPGDLVQVLGCILPVTIAYALPLAFLVGLLLALRRMGSDGELEGIRAGGLGVSVLLLPALALGLCVSLLLGWLLGDVEHQSRRQLVQLFKSVAARGAILEPGKFREIGDRLIFVEDRNREGDLHGVMIYDQTQPGKAHRIFARRGRFEFSPESAEIKLELFDGDVHLEPNPKHPGRYERIRFDEFSYRVDVGQILGHEFGPVRPKQMSFAQLESVLARAEDGDPLRELDERDPLEYALEIHRRRAQPFAPLLFAAIGVPIALASERKGRNRGLLIALLAALAYYALTALTGRAVREDLFSAALGSWLPNLAFGLVAVVLYQSQRHRIVE